MMLETIGISLLLSSGLLTAIRSSNMSDKKKIEKIFEYTKTWVTTEKGELKKCQYIRKADVINNNKVIGIEYVYRLPLGMPYKKLEYLNDNIGVFKDGLHKNVEVEYDGGMLHIYVYESDLVKKWDYELLGNKWEVVIGKTFKDTIMLDFDQTQNLIGGGSVRYGKTNLIKVIMASLIANNPDNVELYLIDLKAGVEFSRYENLRQVKGVAINPAEAHTLLYEVMMQLEIRQNYFKQMGWNNVVEAPFPKRTFVIIDEAGDLAPESFMSKEEKNMHKECQWMLSHVARIGPAFGFRELFFSQYTTADILPRAIKQVADAKICFKIQNDYASEVVLGEGNTQASGLPRIRGRGYFIDGPDLYELQVPYISDKQMEELLQDHYVTRRKDITHESTANENTDNVIEFRDID